MTLLGQVPGEPITKDDLIEWLITDDIDNIRNTGPGIAGYEWLETILRNGFIGYRKQSKKELEQEYNERKPQ